MVIERRAAPRFPLRILGLLTSSNGAGISGRSGASVRVKDISLRGALLVPEAERADGTAVHLRLDWPKGGSQECVLESAGEIQAVRKIGFEEALVVVFQQPPILIEKATDTPLLELESPTTHTPALFKTPRINDRAFQAYKQLSQVQRFVQQHYAEDITIGKVARVAAMEMTYFSAFFHRKVGITYQAWLRRFRVAEAMALLTEVNRSISEVAAEVGYPEVRTFERAFKKVTDLTPSGFRKLVRPNYLDALEYGSLDFSGASLLKQLVGR